jgi:hypothetical protein
MFAFFKSNLKLKNNHILNVAIFEWIKEKNRRKEDLVNFKTYFIYYAHNVLSIENIISKIEYFSPYLFKDLKDYSDSLIKNLNSYNSFITLKQINLYDKNDLTNKIIELISNNMNKNNNINKIFFYYLKTKDLKEKFKELYNNNLKKVLSGIIKDYSLGYYELLNSADNLLFIDSTLLKNIFEKYCELILETFYEDENSRVKHLLKFSKKFNKTKPKDILFELNKYDDTNQSITVLIKKFPQLKAYSSFI